MRTFQPRPLTLLLVGGMLWVCVVMQLYWAPQFSHVPVRAGAVVFLLAVAWHLIGSLRPVLLTPLFVLSAIAIVFFSLGPSLMLMLPTVERYLTMSENLEAAQRYVSAAGELVVLQFAVCGLVASVCFGPVAADRLARRGNLFVPAERAVALAVMAFSLVVAAGVPFVLTATALPLPSPLQEPVHRELLHGAPAILSFAVALLFLTAVGRRARWLAVACIGTAFAVAFILSGFMAKTGVFMAVSGVGAYLVFGRVALKRAIAVGAGTIVIAVIAITVTSIVRPSTAAAPFKAETLYHHFVVKMLQRQTVTVGCLQDVVENMTTHRRYGNSLYFLPAVVPRILWDDKPDLSRGAEYAVAYCHFDPDAFSEEFPHSASITLLGEPVSENGWNGLAVAQFVLLAILFGGAFGAFRTGTVGVACLVAMLPWLIDFDMHFALYFALSFKMLVWVLIAAVPCALLNAWYARRSQRRAVTAA